jgi:hypothetical protein
MTPAQRFGISCCLMILFFSACFSLQNLQKGGRILKEAYHYYVNDSLQFSYRMPGDYEAVVEKKTIKRSLILDKLPLNPKNCLAYYKTTVKPELEHYLFYFADTAADYKADSSATPIYNYMIKNTMSNKITILLPPDDYVFFLRRDDNELILSSLAKSGG